MSRLYYRFLIVAFYLFLQSSQSFSTIGVSLTAGPKRHGTTVFLASTNVKSKDNDDTLERDNDNTKQTPNLSIEYCTGCRWLLRASWFMQECLTTFENELGSVTLIPSKPPSPGGTFLLKLDNVILWDRTVEKSFPEAKVIKRLIRDQISPTKDLGHSDVKNIGSAVVAAGEKCVECEEVRGSSMIMDDRVQSKQVEEENVLIENRSLPNVNIRYCNESKWMMRANWICQEVLATFQEEVRSVTLTPVRSLTQEGGNRGIFEVSISNRIIWNNKKDGKEFHVEEIKARIGDIVAPDKDLGFDHDDDVDDVGAQGDNDDEQDEIDDDEAAVMRSYFGVL